MGDSGLVRPDFVLVSMPFAGVGRVLAARGIDYAINIPTVAAPPMVSQAAWYIPVAFHHVPPYNLEFKDRFLVFTSNAIIWTLKHLGAFAGFHFSLMPDMDPTMWWNRLILVNSFPGFGYPMSLPPLVQYTGPVLDLAK